MDEQNAVAADYARILARILGVNSSELHQFLNGTSLSPDQFMAKEGYLSWADQYQIIQNAMRRSSKPGLGLIAATKAPPPVAHGVLGMAAMSCENALEALQVLTHYQSIRTRVNPTSMLSQGQFIVLRLNFEIEMDEVGNFLLEAWLGSVASVLSLLFGKDIASIVLHMNFSVPKHFEVYRKYLPCQLQFNQDFTQFCIPKYLSDKPVITHDSQAKKWALALCEQHFQHLKQPHNFAERIRNVLRRSTGHLPTQETVASELNVSTRTLSRRLKAEGFTFKQLVDDEQKRLARHYFDHTQLNIETISDLVGYQDISSFRRAFKRWFHMPPSQYPRPQTSI